MITIPGIAPDMIANNIEPAYPTHPGEVLKKNWSPEAFHNVNLPHR